MTEQVIPARIGPWPVNLLEHREYFYRSRGYVWELMRLAHCRTVLEPGMVVYDVGSECGDFSALYATWECEVVCFEPQPGYWPSIKAHFEGNDAMPLGCFVGFAADEGTDDPVKDAWPSESEGGITPEAGFLHLPFAPNVARTSVDWVAASERTPDALMIDVEGAEYRVLQGAVETLKEHHPHLWVSVHSDQDWMAEHYPDSGIDAIRALLEPLGYEGTELAVEHEAHWYFG